MDYVHAGVFVPVFNPAEDPDKFCFSPLGSTAPKLAYWDKEAYVHELLVSSGPKQAAATTESQTKSAADLAAAAAEGEGLVPPGKEGEAKVKKRKAEAATAAAKPKKVRCLLFLLSSADLIRPRRHIFNSGATVMLNYTASNRSHPEIKRKETRNQKMHLLARRHPTTAPQHRHLLILRKNAVTSALVSSKAKAKSTSMNG